MFTYPRYSNLLIMIVSLSSIFFTVACDGGSDGDSKSLKYMGLTSKAAIDQSNSVELTVGSAREGMRGNSFSSIARSTAPPDDEVTREPHIYHIALIIMETVTGLPPQSTDTNAPIRTVQTGEETIPGSCGGQAVGKISVDDETGEFWGKLSFQDFCVGSITMNGDTKFSGTMDLAVNEIDRMNMVIDYLSCSDTYGTYILDGSLSITPDFSGSLITMDMLVQSGSKENIFWLNNYRMEIMDFTTYMTMNISGRFYDPAYGYVVVSTPVDINADSNAMVPDSGSLMVVGATGTDGGPTWAELTCTGGGTFTVEMDSTGDGIVDWDSGQMSWKDF